MNDLFGTMTEIFCVDTSTDMNDLAKWILKKGKANDSLPTGVFFRLALPVSNDVSLKKRENNAS